MLFIDFFNYYDVIEGIICNTHAIITRANLVFKKALT